MYPGWTNPDAARTYPAPERSSSYSSREVRTYAYPQTAALPPRPLEPRPTLQSSHSEPSVLPRSQDAYHHTDGPGVEYRSRGQNLPGLKDILNAQPYPSSRQSYTSTWTASGSANPHADPESYPVANGIHPPMVLHPPTTANQRYQSQLGKPYDLPISETSRQPLPALSSSYPGFPEPGRDYSEPISERLKDLSTTSLLSNGIPSSYRPALQDDSQYRGQSTGSYRSNRTSHPGSGAESYGRYLGIEDVAGEGKFHVYADGSRIPTQVDGEQVNPQWGLTKANKPRKRLALACLDCREKKIKCEPGVSSCIQCEKAMRPCRRPPEKYLQSDTTTNTLWIAGSPVRQSATESETTTSSVRDPEADFLSKRRSRADPSPPLSSNKRQRSMSPHFDRVERIDSLRRDDTSPADTARSHTLEDTRKDSLMWENDPYAVEPDLTLHLVNLYFDHINNATYCMFPRRHFLHWLKTCSIKCQNEKMLLYSMLAAATVFVDDHRLSGIGKQCAQISGDAIASEVGRYTVSNAISKMLLALYHFAKGHQPLAWEYVGSSIRTVTYMNLNTEEGCKDDRVSRRQTRYDYEFTPEQLTECKRRTFWSCFLQDRYCAPTMCLLKPEDIFVRLPSSDEIYEQGTLASNAPYFINDILDPLGIVTDPAKSLAPMAWLVLVAGVWGDVIDFGHRALHKPDSTYAEFYEKSYSRLQSRLLDWHGHLPPHLQYSAANLDRSIQEDYVGTFVSMHTLYHLTIIKLNRYMRHALIPESVSRNIRTANYHGHQILQIMTALHLARRDILTPAEGHHTVPPFSTPFPGYAVLLAVDTVSAGGLDSNLRETLDEIDGALDSLRELEQYWSSSKDQLRECQKRFYQLKNVTISPKNAVSGCWLGRKWGIKTSLEPEYTPENDCIYGLGEKDGDEAQNKYYDAFKED